MKYKAYGITLVLIIFFQSACGDSNSQKEAKQKTTLISKSKDEKQELVSISDTLKSKEKVLSDASFPIIILGMSNTDKARSEEHTSELQSRFDLVCRLLLE